SGGRYPLGPAARRPLLPSGEIDRGAGHRGWTAAQMECVVYLGVLGAVVLVGLALRAADVNRERKVYLASLMRPQVFPDLRGRRCWWLHAGKDQPEQVRPGAAPGKWRAKRSDCRRAKMRLPSAPGQPARATGATGTTDRDGKGRLITIAPRGHRFDKLI